MTPYPTILSRFLRPGGLVSLALACAVGTGLSVQGASPRVILTPAPGYSLTWDGNNGGFNSPDLGAGPSNNIALASNGTVAFTSGDLGPELGLAFHVAANLNDGLYGNANSWISGSPDAPPFAGLSFPDVVSLRSIAWGRDNGNTVADACGGTCTDRNLGTYTIQFTQIIGADRNTPETGDAATGWADLGTVQFLAGIDDATFASYLRHRFDVAEGGNAISAMGIRIKVPTSGLAGGTAIDELEVNPLPDPAPPVGSFLQITPASGYAISWDRNEGRFHTTSPSPVPPNDASASRGTVAFGTTQLGPTLGLAFHRFINVNDGFYGNSASWIPDFITGDPAPSIGLNLGKRVLVRSVAWGRDNDSGFTDRALGNYTLQVTTVPNPGPATPDGCGDNSDTGWITVGSLNYKASSAVVFNAHLRHRFDVSKAGSAIPATGIRILVPNANSAIDEIEINPNTALENNIVRITNGTGATLVWDGNDGQFNNPAVGAAPPENRALATQGTVPFSSSDLGPVLGIPFHRAVNLNDGLYGNANSWISANGTGGATDPAPFVGLNFGASVSITNIAWSRDNGNVGGDCCGGTLTDRALDTYKVQFTTVAAPDATTPETGDATSGWRTLATVTYTAAAAPFFNPYLRHRFDVGSPLAATGIRIMVGNGATAIDEIEVNTSLSAPPVPAPVVLTAQTGYTLTWDGNDGHYRSAAAGAAPPDNQALASRGGVAFSSSDLGPVLGIPFHVAANLNDGLYGNAHSWISGNGIGATTDPDPSCGISFGNQITIKNIAWGRDNGDDAEGVFMDRALGNYTIQITDVPSPNASTPETGDKATGWATIGTVEYRQASPPDFTPHLRHRFDVTGAEATGVRVKVSNGQMDIDELEVNTAKAPQPRMTIERTGGVITIQWTEGGVLESAGSPAGPWVCAGGSGSPFTVNDSSGAPKFYRVRK